MTTGYSIEHFNLTVELVVRHSLLVVYPHGDRCDHRVEGIVIGRFAGRRLLTNYDRRYRSPDEVHPSSHDSPKCEKSSSSIDHTTTSRSPVGGLAEGNQVVPCRLWLPGIR